MGQGHTFDFALFPRAESNGIERAEAFSVMSFGMMFDFIFFYYVIQAGREIKR